MKDKPSSLAVLNTQGAPKKLLGGTFFTLFGWTVYCAFVVAGYHMNVLCTALEGRRSKLPNWTNIGSLFNEGLKPVLIALAFSSPIIVLVIIELMLQTAELFATSYLWPFHLLFILAISALLPLALIRSVVTASFKSAFEIGRIVAFIKKNSAAYLSAWFKSALTYLVALAVCLGFAILAAQLHAAFGFPGLLVGTALTLVVAAFAIFSCTIVVVYQFAHGYRSSKPFDDDANGNLRASIAIPPPLIK